MKRKNKSKLLQQIELIIENYDIPRILLTRAQFEKICHELFPNAPDKKKLNEFNYRGKLIAVWPLSPSRDA